MRSRVVLGILALLAAAAPAQAHHTPEPRTVTLVGSLQSELGCPGDWQPECAASMLQRTGAGVYRGTFDVPPGNHEYKVAINGSWDENYGAGGQPGGSNIALDAPGGSINFTYDHSTHVISDDAPLVLGRERAAHWLREDVIAWDIPEQRDGFTYRLHAAPDGGLAIVDGAIAGGTSFPLALAALPAELRSKFPHLASYEALTLPAGARAQARTLLKGQLVVAAYDSAGALVGATGVQIPGVLDDLYASAYRADLGPTWRHGRPSLALWAPTAKHVALLLDGRRVAMRRDHDGVWRVKGEKSWRGSEYAFEVTVYVPALDEVATNVVTDPYSLALTTNSRRSVLADLRDPALMPSGWERLRKPRLAQPEDTTIYELHVRDFSITDETVAPARRGTFLAFAERHSDGMRHLRALADSGMNTLHLLPSNDIATIQEDRSLQLEPPCDLAAFGPASEEQQECVDQVKDADGFNWGYDPLHYTTPEGSYATDPDGTARTREFRAMVKGINRAGLRVVMDVVYNHTPAAGQDPKSILDRIVPGYYHRLSATGSVETSTCCSNTATEHRMMEKLMVESVVTWAREYKVDGFRFDLMGHHSKASMLKVRRALDKLDRDIYVYGEGWNFGEVANDARFVQATQLNMAGTGIGTFSDRLRDAVRGGGPFDSDPRIQGFASGLFTDPNGAPVNGAPEQQRAKLLLHHDQIKVGLAGNLRDYRFVDRNGATVTGAQVDYNGQPAGYAGEPDETITYVDAHDNETLFDVLQYKLPVATSMADRVRMNTLALATTALGQSPSFWHAGNDLLRSKSLDRNSFNSGDWFNRIDWSANESTWGSGLPPRTDNESKWGFMRPLLERSELEPGPADLRAARERARELLRIRFSSPLFRLGSAEEIQRRVRFPTGGPSQTPGVIVMAIDGRHEAVAVVFNASDEPTTQTVASLAGRGYRLHRVQRHGGDPVVRGSAYDADTGAFTVPARTVAVFETELRKRRGDQ
jgi:pullulanase-type alpha-1,6-glucosidase